MHVQEVGVPNSRGSSGFWLVPENLCFFSAQSQSSRTRSRFMSSYMIDTSRPVACHMSWEEKSSNHSTKCRGDRSTYPQETHRKYAGLFECKQKQSQPQIKNHVYSKHEWQNVILISLLFLLRTRGLEALMWMLFFKFSVIIIGFCVKSEVQ